MTGCIDDTWQAKRTLRGKLAGGNEGTGRAEALGTGRWRGECGGLADGVMRVREAGCKAQAYKEGVRWQAGGGEKNRQGTGK